MKMTLSTVFTAIKQILASVTSVLITPEKPKIWRNLQVLNKHFPLSEFDLMQLGIFDRMFNIIVATPWPGVWVLVRVAGYDDTTDPIELSKQH